jgi:TPR repeat protein
MKRFICIAALLLLCLPVAAQAGLKYMPDPVYKPLDPAEDSPMQDMLILAEDGDVRAQYILGDLYSKGKGGLPKDFKQSARWFDLAAKNGYYEALVRLGALAKRQKKPVEAYRWYALAAEHLGHGPWRKHAAAEKDAIKKESELTPEDLTAARKAANLWKSELREYQEEQRRLKREAIKKEREEKKKAESPKQEKKKS